MDMRGDRRAQAMQVGAVVLVGVAIVALSVYQVTSVPQQNRQVEAVHDRQVTSQLQGVREAVLRTAATGSPHSAVVTLGTGYPGRVIAVNPTPATGTIETVPPGPTGQVSISNATAVSPETADYWNGSERAFDTRAIAYSPDYNEFENAPTTAYGSSLLYTLFGADPLAGSATVRGGEALSNQTVVDGKRITLVTLDGSFSRTGSENVSVEARPVSVSNTTVPLTNATGERVELALSTQATNETWQRVLTPELAANDGYVDTFTCSAPTDDEPCGVLTVTFEPTSLDDPYVLRMAKVGVGSGASTDGPRYLTNVTDREVSVPENASQRLELEVRDPYNNPVENASVNLTVFDRSVLRQLGTATGATVNVGELRADGERGSTVEARTDENGRAVVRYVAPRSINGTSPANVSVIANRTAEPDPTANRTAANSTGFDLTVRNADSSPVAHRVRWDRSALANRSGVRCGPDRCIYDRSTGELTVPIVANATGGDEPVRGVDVALANRDRSVVRYTRADDVTNGAGRASATIDVLRPGTTTVAVAGGPNSTGSGDRLTLTIANRVPEAAGAYVPQNATSGTSIQFDARRSADPDGRIVEYQWAFGDGSRAFGPRPKHIYNRSGTYNATLTVTDEHGATDTTSATIEVGNRPPEAAFEFPLTAPEPGQVITFDASSSSDPDGEVATYEWDFGDGSADVAANISTVSHSYDEPGTYIVSLRVTDDDGSTDILQKSVTVDAAEADGRPAVGNDGPLTTAVNGTAGGETTGNETAESGSAGNGTTDNGTTGNAVIDGASDDAGGTLVQPISR
jgi:PKD repeat protein